MVKKIWLGNYSGTSLVVGVDLKALAFIDPSKVTEGYMLGLKDYFDIIGEPCKIEEKAFRFRNLVDLLELPYQFRIAELNLRLADLEPEEFATIRENLTVLRPSPWGAMA
jgi:hypothetical protein